MAIRRLSTASIKTGSKSNKVWDQDTQQGAMVPIANGLITSAPTTISNIPQTYQDLQLVVQVANSSSNFLSYIYFGSNNGLHNGTVMYGIGGGGVAASSRYTNDNSVLADYPATLGMISSTSIFSSHKHDILNYANTTMHKTILSHVASDQNGSGYVSIGAHALRNTAAISAVFISFGGGGFSGGSNWTLYGIKAGA